MNKKVISFILGAFAISLMITSFSPKTVKADINDGYITMDEALAICNAANNELADARSQYDMAREQLRWARDYGTQDQLSQAVQQDAYWSQVVNHKIDKVNHTNNIYNSVANLRTDLQYIDAMRDKLNNLKIIGAAEQEVTVAQQAVLTQQTIVDNMTQCANQANANAALNPGFQPVADQANANLDSANNALAAAQANVVAKQAAVNNLKATLPLPSDAEMYQIALIKKDFEPVEAEFAIANNE